MLRSLWPRAPFQKKLNKNVILPTTLPTSNGAFKSEAPLHLSMTSAFEVAWSILKSDPRSQAWSRENFHSYPNTHPDVTNLNDEDDNYIENRGTIDPNVMSMARDFLDYPDVGYVPTEAQPMDSAPFTTNYKHRAKDNAFEAVSPHGISRMPRPHAETIAAPYTSPQGVIDDFIRQNVPARGPQLLESVNERAERLTPMQQRQLEWIASNSDALAQERAF